MTPTRGLGCSWGGGDAGKCTVTAASTVEQAQAVAGVIGKLVIDLFVQVRSPFFRTHANIHPHAHPAEPFVQAPTTPHA
jgi:hypothetical protein